MERNPMPRKPKMPAILFFTGDWLKDPATRCMSLEARGLWIDMLCLMYESPRRGYLALANGKPVTATLLARMTGSAIKDVKRLLEEMEDCGVYSKEGEIIYSRRMVRDEEDREKKSRAGKIGMDNRWGNKVDNKGDNKRDNTSVSSLEIEDEIEIDIENEIVTTNNKHNSSNNYLAHRRARQAEQPNDVMAVLSNIPSNRLNNPNKTKIEIENALNKLEQSNPEQERQVIAEMLGARIAMYYDSDEGRGEYAKRPHNWLADECYLADPSSWCKTTDEKTGWNSIERK